MSASEQLVLHV